MFKSIFKHGSVEVLVWTAMEKCTSAFRSSIWLLARAMIPAWLAIGSIAQEERDISSLNRGHQFTSGQTTTSLKLLRDCTVSEFPVQLKMHERVPIMPLCHISNTVRIQLRWGWGRNGDHRSVSWENKAHKANNASSCWWNYCMFT